MYPKQGNRREACALAQRALTVCSQALENAHPKTIAAQALVVQLLQEQTNAGVEAAAPRHSEVPGDPRSNERQEDSTSSPLPEAVPLAPAEHDPLQRFLDACCERHPLAWCRSADLWQAYQGWVKARQERYSLSRGAFIAQVKAHGCRADRTMSARIWRGIALVKSEHTMMDHDGPRRTMTRS